MVQNLHFQSASEGEEAEFPPAQMTVASALNPDEIILPLSDEPQVQLRVKWMASVSEIWKLLLNYA